MPPVQKEDSSLRGVGQSAGDLSAGSTGEAGSIGLEAGAVSASFVITRDYADGLLRLANHDNYLEEYEPADLITGVQGLRYRAVMDEDVRAMWAAAARDGINLVANSAYRSKEHQSRLWNNGVATHGRAWAEQWLARPGHSEHQLGLAIDFSISASFGRTAAGIWLRENSWRYGFILRYTEENRAVTGINAEPWHFRYVGRRNAWLYSSSGVGSLEEFLGV